ncbi:alpha/beta hydrolase [Treponema vincentii]|uniref:alpha/beta fold hydrolase n=1 Tax=Treponema vincentii TaxID=69710 RepID=UPI003D8CA06E
MIEKTYKTSCGIIHYWISKIGDATMPALIFLPGLTADHRLFEKQILYFENKYTIFVWDAPGHASSWPFEFSFSLKDKAVWLDGILLQEHINRPVIVGQSMGGYVGQMYSQLFPNKLKGFISIDSAPLQRSYMTGIELWLLKRIEPIYRHYPWKHLLKAGVNGVAVSDYGRNLMKEMMLFYNNQKNRYAKIAGHGYEILAEAVAADLPYRIDCSALLICGEKDKAGSCIRYNKLWHKRTGIPIEWIKDAGHNSNTDKPNLINNIINNFIEKLL